MKLPPAWKVKRELERIRVKLELFVSGRLYDPLRKPIYDLTARRRQRLTQGNMALTDRVAVFVVYQPKGIPPSIFLTLEHLRQNRFSVLLVSNGPLRPEDRTRLAQDVSLVLERPNVGYDFGGYRDGIRHLWSLKQDLSLLVLMNDSTWFPLRRDDDSLARMEALGVDLAGHIIKQASIDFDHVESHLLMFGPVALASPAIQGFWSNYVMSDLRLRTIMEGEVALTQLALRQGLSVRALLDPDQLLKLLLQLPSEELLKVVRQLALQSEADSQTVANWISSADLGDHWREDFLNWTVKELSTSREHFISTTFVDVAVRLGGMGFLKKSDDPRFHLARQALLNGIKAGRIKPVDPIIAHEVQDAVSLWIASKNWERATEKLAADIFVQDSKKHVPKMTRSSEQ
jgi:hypothetical protein